MAFGKPSSATAPGGALAGSALSFGALGEQPSEFEAHQAALSATTCSLAALAVFAAAVIAAGWASRKKKG